jgi:hypothetical protein
VAKKAAAKKVATKKVVARKPAAKKAATKKVATRQVVARKPAAKKAAAKKVATRPAARKPTPSPAPITPEQALENTRKLLEAKQAHARETPPWQEIGQPAHVPEAGFQSDEARAKANELHESEARLQANQGSVSTVDRHNQGKRDARS